MYATNPENEAVVEKIEAVLAEIPMGETLAYSVLSKAAGKNVQNGARHLLNKARDRAEKSLGCVFESVRDVGIQRLASDHIADVGLAAVRKCRSAAKRGKKRLDRVNSNSLSPTEHRRVIGYSAMLGAVAMISDGRKAQAIATVADPTKPIPPQNILDMFRT